MRYCVENTPAPVRPIGHALLAITFIPFLHGYGRWSPSGNRAGACVSCYVALSPLSLTPARYPRTSMCSSSYHITEHLPSGFSSFIKDPRYLFLPCCPSTKCRVLCLEARAAPL